MEKVTMIQTFDGELHSTGREARKHLDKMYANKLCPLAAKLTAITKYAEMCDFIDQNIMEFIELQNIKNGYSRR